MVLNAAFKRGAMVPRAMAQRPFREFRVYSSRVPPPGIDTRSTTVATRCLRIDLIG
jgi:hypothetical protein